MKTEDLTRLFVLLCVVGMRDTAWLTASVRAGGENSQFKWPKTLCRASRTLGLAHIRPQAVTHQLLPGLSRPCASDSGPRSQEGRPLPSCETDSPHALHLFPKRGLNYLTSRGLRLLV